MTNHAAHSKARLVLTNLGVTPLDLVVDDLVEDVVEMASIPEAIRVLGEDLRDLVSNISWVVLAVSGILVVVGLVARISSATFYTKYCMHQGATSSYILHAHAVLNRRDGRKSFRVQALFSMSLIKPQLLFSNYDVTH